MVGKYAKSLFARMFDLEKYEASIDQFVHRYNLSSRFLSNKGKLANDFRFLFPVPVK